MIVEVKDLKKAIAVVIISFCAVFVTTLFFNFYLDLKDLDINTLNLIQKKFYDTQLIVSKFVIIVTGVILSISSAIMLLFYIKQHIDQSKHKIGILKALGYSNMFISKNFSVFSLLIFLGTFLGFGSSYLLMPKFYESRNKDNILINLTIDFHLQPLIYLVLLPTLLFLILSMMYVLLKLNVPTTVLLKQLELKNKIIKKRKLKIQEKFIKELESTILYSNKTLIFFIIFAAMSFSSMIQMSLGMRDFVDTIIRMIMTVIGVILSLSILLITLEVIVSNNKKNISILNIMGYSVSECSQIVLFKYRIVALIGFIIGTVYQYVLIKVLLIKLSKELDSQVVYNFDYLSLLISSVLFILIYELFIRYYYKKIRMIDAKKIILD
jgi:ABC transporter permease protein